MSDVTKRRAEDKPWFMGGIDVLRKANCGPVPVELSGAQIGVDLILAGAAITPVHEEEIGSVTAVVLFSRTLYDGSQTGSIMLGRPRTGDHPHSSYHAAHVSLHDSQGR